MAPSGGATIEVDQPMTWSPENSELVSFERIGHVIGAMARRRNRLQRPARSRDDISVAQRMVGTKVHVAGGIERIDLADMKRPRDAVRPLAIGRRTGRSLYRGRCRGMIAMRVGEKDMRDRFSAHGAEQSLDVALVVRSRIDDGDIAPPDDVADGALEREGRGIAGA